MKLLYRFLSILMPILFLAYTQYPCADRYDIPTSVQSNSTTSLLSTADHSSIAHLDACSPLCACTCCAASITSVVLNIDFTYFEMTYNYIPTYYKEIPTGVYISIWQPPKIA